jgi:hypothetical protein
MEGERFNDNKRFSWLGAALFRLFHAILVTEDNSAFGLIVNISGYVNGLNKI